MSLVSEQAEVAAVDERLGELATERRAYEAWVSARGDEYVLAMQAHAEHVDAALAADAAPPAEPRPAWPIERHHDKVAGFVGRATMLADERQRAVAAAAPDVRAAARQEVADVLDDAAAHVEALDALARRVHAARAALVETEGAVDTVTGQRRSLDWGHTPTAADVLEAGQGRTTRPAGARAAPRRSRHDQIRRAGRGAST